MIRIYFKTTIRNLLKNKTYSAVNILGLAVGLAGFILVLLYLNFELSYDKWNPALEKVYKVYLKQEGDILPQTPAPLASFLAEKYPEVEAGTRIQSAGEIEILLAANDKKIYQKGMVMSDSLFLKVFPYQLVKGNPATVLNSPNAVVLSEELSRKLFGDADPIGKPLRAYNAIDGVITGVFKEPETPSHLVAKLIMRDPYEVQNKFWTNYSYQTYLRFRQRVQEGSMEDIINRLYYNERIKKGSESYEAYRKADPATALFTDAVPHIHNFPEHGFSNFKTVAVLVILAILLLIAGSINFSNLSIARSIARAKEIGVRKVLGSGRGQLIGQFMTETFFQCMLSLSIAFVLVALVLPYLNRKFELSLGFGQQNEPQLMIFQVLACLVLVALLSGLYPSFVLTRFKMAKVLKGDYSTGQKGVFFRNVLIVLQFMVAAFFIITVIIISSQMQYMKSREKGFSDAQVLRIQAAQKTRDAGFETVRAKLLSLPGIRYVAKTTSVPGDAGLLADTASFSFKYEGKLFRAVSEKISADYFKTLGIEVVKGRAFSDAYSDQHTRTAVINETAARSMNITNPMGQVIYFPECDTVPVQVIGVVKDIHILGFETMVQPVIYTIGNNACMFQSGGALLVKLGGEDLQSQVAGIEETWKTIEPDSPIRYSFLDDNFQRLFVSYNRLQQVIMWFAGVAILISVMGLFALTAYLAKQRTKEIGMRKVLGASVTQLATMLGKEFVYLILLAISITIPLAWWAMDNWLQTFAYRIHISWWMFAGAAAVLVLIALLTIGAQVVKAAVANPVTALRSE
jgi:putative ABC transport system permease protein